MKIFFVLCFCLCSLFVYEIWCTNCIMYKIKIIIKDVNMYLWGGNMICNNIGICCNMTCRERIAKLELLVNEE